MKLMKRGLSLLLALTMVLGLFTGIPLAQAETTATGNVLYVATNGSDSNDGTIDAPLATLEAARNKARTLTGGVTVYLREGVYPRTETFKLMEDDSGTATAPVTYAAYPGETVELRGSQTLDGSDFAAVTDEAILARLSEDAQSKVKVIDLSELGITFPTLRTNLYTMVYPNELATVESLSVNGEKQILARYPNSGSMTISSLINGGLYVRGHMIQQDGVCVETCFGPCEYPQSTWLEQAAPSWYQYSTELAAKAALWAQEANIFASGYFQYHWANDTVELTASAVDGGVCLTGKTPVFYGVNGSGSYYVYNMLCELDTSGEYYVDRENSLLYLYTDADLSTASVELAVLGSSFIQLEGAEHVKIENLGFKHSSGSGVELLDCENVLVAGCDFYDLGKRAVMIGDPSSDMNTGARGGFNNKVLSCNIKSIGEGGVFLAGGNRYTLTAGNNQVVNCDIEDYSVIKRTGAPAVELEGCGNQILNNRIHNAPHVGIQYVGNNHLMQDNEIFGIMYETSDIGAIYTGRAWTYQGNVINNNYIHDLYTNAGVGSSAFYMDDMVCGTAMTNNLLVNLPGRTVLFGGGRDLVFTNNIQINNGNGSGITTDDRGLGWGDTMAAKPGGELYVDLMTLIQDSTFDWTEWTDQYPTLMEMVDQTTKEMNNLETRTLSNGQQYEIAWVYMNPGNNTIQDNILVGVSGESISSGFRNTTYNNVYEESSKYAAGTDIGLDLTNFTVEADSIIKETLGDEHFNVATVGLYNDAYRTNVSAEIPAPTLLTPANEAADEPYVSGVAMSWSAVSDADNYVVEIASDAAFENIVLTKTLETTSWNAGPLEKETTYYWRVTAAQSFLNGASATSEVRSFTTNDEEYASFYEGFGKNYSFEGWDGLGSSPSVTSENAHAGSYSYVLDNTFDCIKMTLPVPQKADLTIWMYDSGIKNDRTEVMSGINTPEVSNIYIGVNAFDSSGSDDNYSIRIGDVYTVTDVVRSKGWHKLQWIWTETGVKMMLDDTQIGSVDGVSSISSIVMGDLWSATSGASGFMFDDISFGDPILDPVYNSIALDKTEVTLEVGEELQLHALVDAVPDVDAKLNWRTIASETVYVANGYLTAAREGTDTVEVSIDGTNLTATCTVTVVSKAPDQIPAMVTGMSGRALGNGAMLSWNAAAEAETYAVYRDDGTGWTKIADGLTGTSYTDSGLTYGTTYAYRVTAVNDLGTGTASVAVKIPCTEPVFFEDYEAEDALSDWNPISSVYNVGMRSDKYAHSGNYSYACDPSGSFSSSRIILSAAQNKVVEMWLYDGGTGQMLGGISDEAGNTISVGVLQIGPATGVLSNYGMVKKAAADTGNTEVALNIARSTNWHQIIFDARTSTVKAYIDGVEVGSQEGFADGFNTITIHCSWGGAMGELYWDNISVLDEIPTMLTASTEAEAVAVMIDAIGTVTEASGDSIAAARAAYNALDDQSVVPNADKLEAAEAAYENIVNPPATKLPAMVTGLTGASQGGSKAALSWTASEEAKVYDVYRNDGSGWAKIADDVQTTSYADTNLTGGETYSYRVVAANELGEATPSVSIAVTVNTAVFYEDYEAEDALDKWTVMADVYNIGLRSTNYAHSGSYSYRSDTNPAPAGGGNAFTSSSYAFDEAQYKVLEMWIYDGNCDNGQMVGGVVDVAGVHLDLGVMQIGIAQPVNTYYCVKTPSIPASGVYPAGEAPSTVARSTGWHQLVIDARTSTAKAYIDGVEVASVADFQGIQSIRMYCAWGTAAMGEVYFDDIAVLDNMPVIVRSSTAAEQAAILIDAIGTVTADSGDAIAAARTAYDAVTDKAVVPNGEKLLAAEEAYQKYASRVSFYESFGGSDYAFTGWTLSATASVTDTNAHAGTYSYITDEVENLQYALSQPTEGTLSIWMYDHGQHNPAADGKGEQGIAGACTTKGDWIAIAIDDAQFGNHCYWWKYGGQEVPTTIERTVGWHEVKLVLEDGICQIYLDDTLVTTLENVENFATIGFGDFWGPGPASNFLYDDIRLNSPTITTTVKSVTLDQTAVTLDEKGATTQLKATAVVEPDVDSTILWTTSDLQVATVSATGVVTAVGNGTATITAHVSGSTTPAATCAVTVAIAPTEFRESFENGMSAWSEIFGTATLTDSNAKSGTYSYQIDEAVDCANKVFDTPLQTSMSVWMYDPGTNGVEVIAGFETAEGQKVFLGVGTSKSDNYYFYRTDKSSNWQDAVEATSTVARTTGWHKLSFICNGDGTYDLYIDAEKVATATNISGIKKVWLGDLWGENAICNFLFDDLFIGDQEAPKPLPSFYESFGDSNYAFTGWSVSATASTTAADAHAGNYSFITDETENLQYALPEATEGTLSIWMYDHGEHSPDSSGKGEQGIAGACTTDDKWIFIGVDDAQFNNHCYWWRYGDSEVPTDIVRTVGWHEIKIVLEDGICKLYLDDALVTTLENVQNFAKIAVGDFWGYGPAGGFLYDDIRLNNPKFTATAKSITLDKTALTLDVPGKTAQLTAVAVMEPDVDATVSWTTSNVQVATVTADGQIKAVGEGTAAITATISGSTVAASCEVTVQYTAHAVTVGTASNGSAEADKAEAKPGETVTITATPNTNYELDQILVNGKALDGTSFTMPNEEVSITVTFKPTADKQAADAVAEKITAIGEVTLESKALIDVARTAYDALTDAQKALVENLSVLEAAEKKYNELVEQAKQEEIDEAAASGVEALINAIGKVTLSDKKAIEAARAAYDALTDAQKALVENYDELVAAETELKALITDAFITGSLIIGSATHPFDDVKNHWAEDAITYVYCQGLMNGVDDDKFAPDATLTRAMVVTILYRLDNEPVTFGAAPFSDVESGSWYAKAVLWASKNNIVNGMGDGSFAPMQNITREQFASILYRYAQYRGERTGARANLNGYTDAGQISGWATEAMAWAAAEGLINGRTATTIAPKGTATRAEAATILMRFCKRF